jgi:hypothetical protein
MVLGQPMVGVARSRVPRSVCDRTTHGLPNILGAVVQSYNEQIAINRRERAAENAVDALSGHVTRPTTASSETPSRNMGT